MKDQKPCSNVSYPIRSGISKTYRTVALPTYLFVCCLIVGFCLFTVVPASVQGEEIPKVTKKLEKVEKSFKKGDIEKALGLLEDLVEKYSTDPRPAVRLARYFLDAKLFNDAIQYAETAFSIDKNSEAAKTVLCDSNSGIGQMNIQMRNFEQAKTAYDKMYDLCPTPENLNRIVYLYSRMAEDAFQRKDYAKAITAYEKILDLEPENEKMYFELFKLYLKASEQAKAIETLENGLQKFPENNKIIKALAAMYFQEKKFEEAKNLFSRVLEKDQNNLLIATYFAYAEQALARQKFDQLKAEDKLPKPTLTPGKTKKSKAAYKKEVEEKKKELIALKQEIFMPVIAAFTKVVSIETETKDPKIQMTMAVLYGFIGKTDEMKTTYLGAADVYKELYLSDPANNLNAFFRECFCRLNASDLDNAEQCFRDVMEIDTERKHPTARIYLAEILVEKKKYEEAKELVEGFIEDFPDNSAISRAEQWKEYIDAAITGTPLEQRPTKLDITEPVIDLGGDDEDTLSLD